MDEKRAQEIITGFINASVDHWGLEAGCAFALKAGMEPAELVNLYAIPPAAVKRAIEINEN